MPGAAAIISLTVTAYDDGSSASFLHRTLRVCAPGASRALDALLDLHLLWWRHLACATLSYAGENDGGITKERCKGLGEVVGGVSELW